MKIDRIFIAGCRLDVRWTQCAVASIRRWHPDVPISLLKDLHHGPYDTAEMERYWNVTLAPLPHHDFGWSWSKLEPLFAATGERIVVMDSDVILRSTILDEWAEFDEDLVVDCRPLPEEEIDRHYFNRERLRALDPEFAFPGCAFNAGIVLATAGVLSREDFEPFVDFTPPPRLRDEATFRCADQGVLNYVVFKKRQRGALTVRSVQMQEWAGWRPPLAERLRGRRIRAFDSRLLHYAGLKRTLLSANRKGRLLWPLEALYLLEAAGRAGPAPARSPGSRGPGARETRVMVPVSLTGGQRLLLQAALAPAGHAAEAYAAWRQAVAFEDVDDEAYRLLPILSRTLDAAGVVDDLTQRLQGVRRRTWCANQIALPALRQAVDRLHTEGVAARILGGPLSILHYRNDPGGYPLDSIDLLSPPEQHEAALAALHALGWRSMDDQHDVRVLAHEHAGFLALHERIAHGLRADAGLSAPDHVWRRPRAVALLGPDAYLVGPEAHLLFLAEVPAD